MKATLLLVTAVTIATVTSPVNGQNTLQDSLTPECYDLMFAYQCEGSTYSRRGADVSLSCGQSYVPAAENFASSCTRNDAGHYCSNLPEFQFGTDESNRITERITTSCASIVTIIIIYLFIMYKPHVIRV